MECSSFTFFIGVEYEKLPDFCQSCKAFGHLETNCRMKLGKDKVNNTSKEDPHNNNTHKSHEARKADEPHIPTEKLAMDIVDSNFVKVQGNFIGETSGTRKEGSTADIEISHVLSPTPDVPHMDNSLTNLNVNEGSQVTFISSDDSEFVAATQLCAASDHLLVN